MSTSLSPTVLQKPGKEQAVRSTWISALVLWRCAPSLWPARQAIQSKDGYLPDQLRSARMLLPPVTGVDNDEDQALPAPELLPVRRRAGEAEQRAEPADVIQLWRHHLQLFDLDMQCELTCTISHFVYARIRENTREYARIRENTREYAAGYAANTVSQRILANTRQIRRICTRRTRRITVLKNTRDGYSRYAPRICVWI